MAKRMTKEEKLAALQSASSRAIGAHDGQLQTDIGRAFDYYYGKPYGDEVEGQSNFVSREVLETIEGMMPYLVKVFFSSDKACVFEPEDADDVDAANQETEYVNWVFYRKNKGFKIGYTWLKDALLAKVGIVKCVREGCFGPKKEVYKNQTPEQVSMLLADMEPDDIEKSQIYIDDESGLMDIEILVSKDESKTIIYNVPPENWRISKGDRDPDTAFYVAEVYKKTVSELRRMGFKVPIDISDESSEVDLNTITISRHEDTSSFITVENADEGMDSPSREVTVHEEYIYLDIDGDGFTELVKFIRVGDNILEEVEVNERPYAIWTPYIIPHRVHGMSAADLIMDVQKLKSQFFRNILDNQFLANNGRYAVIDGQVNLDDVMTSTAHGIVRQNFAGAIEALPTPDIGVSAFQVLGYVDGLSEKRSGVSERSVGLDPSAFNSNTAMGTAEMVMAAAEQKIELIARIFAETGLKDLMLKIHRLGLLFESPDVKIRTNNGEFIPINPAEWRDRDDMTVTVGIGNGSKTQQMFQMSQIMATQQNIVAGGGLGTIVKPSNVYHLAVEQARILGRKDADKFYTKPESDEIDQGPSMEDQINMMKAQIEQFKAQSQAQLDAQKLQLEQQKQLLEEERLELDKQKQLFAEKKHNDEVELRILEARMELQQNRAVQLGPERPKS